MSGCLCNKVLALIRHTPGWHDFSDDDFVNSLADAVCDAAIQSDDSQDDSTDEDENPSVVASHSKNGSTKQPPQSPDKANGSTDPEP